MSGDEFSGAPLITPDGAIVLFASRADNLTTNRSTGGRMNLYLRDRAGKRTQLVSATPQGQNSGNNDTYLGDLSPDGRYVAFWTAADNLVAGSANGYTHVFLRDAEVGVTTLVSVDQQGTGPADGTSHEATLSADGRHVLFRSYATNATLDGSFRGDHLLVRNLAESRTTLANVPAWLYGPSDYAWTDGHAMSSNAQRVAFVSMDAYYLPELTNFASRIFVRDVAKGSSTLATRDLDALWEPVWARNCFPPAMSADGRFVVFRATRFSGESAIIRYDVDSETSELVTTNTVPQSSAMSPPLSADGRYVLYEAPAGPLYRWDGELKLHELVTPASSGDKAANGRSPKAVMSDDGRFVSFVSSSTDLVAAELSEFWNAYVRDMDLKTTRLIPAASRAYSDSEGIPEPPWLTEDGRLAVFNTAEPLVSGDLNELDDVYAVNLQDGSAELISQSASTALATMGNRGSTLSARAVSADARYAIFESNARNLVPTDQNGFQDVFVRDLASGATSLVSVNTNGAAGNRPSFHPVISADGRHLAFLSEATDLAPGDTNALPDVYVRDLRTGSTTLASYSRTGAAAGIVRQRAPQLSSDGAIVLFVSASTAIITGSSSSTPNLFWRDLKTGATYRVNALTLGNWFALSADGQTVAYTAASRAGVYVWSATTRRESAAAGLNAAGRHLTADGTTLFYSVPAAADLQLRAYTIATRKDELIGLLAQPARWGCVSSSDNGQLVAYVAPGTAGAQPNLILFDRAGKHAATVTSTSAGEPPNGPSGLPCLSADGQLLVFKSGASNLVPDDDNETSDVFIYTRSDSSLKLLSRGHSGRAGRGPSTLPLISGNGAIVLFQSAAPDLVEGDFNASMDVFATSTVESPPPPDLTLALTGGSSFALQWLAAPGVAYRLEFTDDLGNDRWSALDEPVVVTNSVARFSGVITGAQRFYRVRAQRQ